MKNIFRDISSTYTDDLEHNFEKIRVNYDIPSTDWNKYLKEISTNIIRTNGKNMPLQLKALSGAGLGGTALFGKAAFLAINPHSALQILRQTLRFICYPSSQQIRNKKTNIV